MSPATARHPQRPNRVTSVAKKGTSYVDISLLFLALAHLFLSLATAPKIPQLLHILVVTVVNLAPNVISVAKSVTSRGRVPKALPVVAIRPSTAVDLRSPG